MPVSPGGSFPQVSNNRTFEQLAREVADHDAGGNSQVRRDRAKESIRDAVREFNEVLWRFNRTQTDIDLSQPADGYDISSPTASDGKLTEYNLPTSWRAPLRAVFVNTQGNEANPIRWVPAEEKFLGWATELSQTNRPRVYTGYNEFQRGRVRFYPRLISPFTWPTVRLYYIKRIDMPQSPEDRLTVPEEVEGAIFSTAVAYFLEKQLGPANANARTARALADDKRLRVQREWRDFADIY